jgi:dTDP-4-amino-4,6-dideoxygalactose transaminase
MRFSPIHQFFAPQTDGRQFLRALCMLCAPWRYSHGKSLTVLEKELSQAFGAEAFLFAIATDALVATLQTLRLKAGDEVIVCGYTCGCVKDAVIAAGGIPVYSDVSPDTLSGGASSGSAY